MKHFKRPVVLILVLTLLLALFAGCGKKDPEAPAAPGQTPGQTPAAPDAGDHPAFVYAAERIPVSDKFTNGFNNVIYNNGKLLVSCYEMIEDNTPEGVVPEYEGQYWEWGEKLYWLSLDGKPEPISGFTALSVPEEEGVDASCYMQRMLLAEDGTIYTLDGVYKNWYDGPDEGGVERYTDEWYEQGFSQYMHSSQDYYLRRLAEDGSELSCVDLAPLKAAWKNSAEQGGGEGHAVPVDMAYPEDDYFYINDMVFGADGRLYFASDEAIFVTDGDGKLLGMVNMNGNYPGTLVAMGDGVSVSFWDYSGDGPSRQVLAPIDAETFTLGEGVSLGRNINLYNMTTAPEGSEYDFCFTSGSSFMGYKAAEDKQEKLLDWLDCDLDSNMMGRTVMLPDGRILALEQIWDDDYSEVEMFLVFLKQVPYDSVPHKQAVTLATQYLDYDMQRSIIKFNRSSPEYRITVQDYSEYNTDEDYSAGLTKLTAEILAGKVPDIIDLNGMPTDQFISKGLLADLYPLIDADSELSREDFFPAVLKALEQDGHIYRTVRAFSVHTLLGAASIVGEEPGWTLAEFKSALAKMPAGCTPLDEGTTRSDIMYGMLYLELNNLIDWDTGECHFDSPAFRDILEFAAQFPETFEYPEDFVWTEENDLPNRIASGRQMLMQMDIYDFDSFRMYNAMFGGKATAIGYPVSEGVGNSLTLSDSGYAISAACPVPEIAWQFVRSTFGDEDNARYYEGFPARMDAFDKMLKDAMTPVYRKDANGNFILDENGEKIEESQGGWGWGSLQIDFYALKQEEADAIIDLLNNTERVAQYDYSEQNEELMNIIMEDTKPYFLGQKPLDEVVRLLQSKLNILVNEKR